MTSMSSDDKDVLSKIIQDLGGKLSSNDEGDGYIIKFQEDKLVEYAEWKYGEQAAELNIEFVCSGSARSAVDSNVVRQRVTIDSDEDEDYEDDEEADGHMDAASSMLKEQEIKRLGSFQQVYHLPETGREVRRFKQLLDMQEAPSLTKDFMLAEDLQHSQMRPGIKKGKKRLKVGKEEKKAVVKRRLKSAAFRKAPPPAAVDSFERQVGSWRNAWAQNVESQDLPSQRLDSSVDSDKQTSAALQVSEEPIISSRDRMDSDLSDDFEWRPLSPSQGCLPPHDSALLLANADRNEDKDENVFKSVVAPKTCQADERPHTEVFTRMKWTRAKTKQGTTKVDGVLPFQSHEPSNQSGSLPIIDDAVVATGATDERNVAAHIAEMGNASLALATSAIQVGEGDFEVWEDAIDWSVEGSQSERNSSDSDNSDSCENTVEADFLNGSRIPGDQSLTSGLKGGSDRGSQHAAEMSGGKSAATGCKADSNVSHLPKPWKDDKGPKREVIDTKEEISNSMDNDAHENTPSEVPTEGFAGLSLGGQKRKMTATKLRSSNCHWENEDDSAEYSSSFSHYANEGQCVSSSSSPSTNRRDQVEGEVEQHTSLTSRQQLFPVTGRSERIKQQARQRFSKQIQDLSSNKVFGDNFHLHGKHWLSDTLWKHPMLPSFTAADVLSILQRHAHSAALSSNLSTLIRDGDEQWYKDIDQSLDILRNTTFADSMKAVHLDLSSYACWSSLRPEPAVNPWKLGTFSPAGDDLVLQDTESMKKIHQRHRDIKIQNRVQAIVNGDEPEFSLAAGQIFICEHLHRTPPYIMAPGMAVELVSYERPEAPPLQNEIDSDFKYDDREIDTCPIPGTVPPHIERIRMMESTMHTNTLFPHHADRSQKVFLLVQRGNKMFLRKVPFVFAAGPQQPRLVEGATKGYEIPTPKKKEPRYYQEDRTALAIQLFTKLVGNSGIAPKLIWKILGGPNVSLSLERLRKILTLVADQKESFAGFGEREEEGYEVRNLTEAQWFAFLNRHDGRPPATIEYACRMRSMVVCNSVLRNSGMIRFWNHRKFMNELRTWQKLIDKHDQVSLTNKESFLPENKDLTPAKVLVRLLCNAPWTWSAQWNAGATGKIPNLSESEWMAYSDGMGEKFRTVVNERKRRKDTMFLTNAIFERMSKENINPPVPRDEKVAAHFEFQNKMLLSYNLPNEREVMNPPTNLGEKKLRKQLEGLEVRFDIHEYPDLDHYGEAAIPDVTDKVEAAASNAANKKSNKGKVKRAAAKQRGRLKLKLTKTTIGNDYPTSGTENGGLNSSMESDTTQSDGTQSDSTRSDSADEADHSVMEESVIEAPKRRRGRPRKSEVQEAFPAASSTDDETSEDEIRLSDEDVSEGEVTSDQQHAASVQSSLRAHIFHDSDVPLKSSIKAAEHALASISVVNDEEWLGRIYRNYAEHETYATRMASMVDALGDNLSQFVIRDDSTLENVVHQIESYFFDAENIDVDDNEKLFSEGMRGKNCQILGFYRHFARVCCNERLVSEKSAIRYQSNRKYFLLQQIASLKYSDRLFDVQSWLRFRIQNHSVTRKVMTALQQVKGCSQRIGLCDFVQELRTNTHKFDVIVKTMTKWTGIVHQISQEEAVAELQEASEEMQLFLQGLAMKMGTSSGMSKKISFKTAKLENVDSTLKSHMTPLHGRVENQRSIAPNSPVVQVTAGGSSMKQLKNLASRKIKLKMNKAKASSKSDSHDGDDASNAKEPSHSFLPVAEAPIPPVAISAAEKDLICDEEQHEDQNDELDSQSADRRRRSEMIVGAQKEDPDIEKLQNVLMNGCQSAIEALLSSQPDEQRKFAQIMDRLGPDCQEKSSAETIARDILDLLTGAIVKDPKSAAQCFSCVQVLYKTCEIYACKSCSKLFHEWISVRDLMSPYSRAILLQKLSQFGEIVDAQKNADVQDGLFSIIQSALMGTLLDASEFNKRVSASLTKVFEYHGKDWSEDECNQYLATLSTFCSECPWLGVSDANSLKPKRKFRLVSLKKPKLEPS